MNKETVLAVLRNESSRRMGVKDIQHRIDDPQANKKRIKNLLTQLVQEGSVRQLKNGKYRFRKSSQKVTGKILMNQKGFGFVVLADDSPDVFIPRHGVRDAVNGDEVEISVKSVRHGLRTRGYVKRVIKRSRDSFVGTVFGDGKKWFLELAPFTPERGVRVKGASKLKLKAGQVVAARVKDWGSSETPVFCEIEKIIGDSNDPRNDVEMIIHSFDYPSDFPEPVLHSIDKLNQSFIDRKLRFRRDLRDRTVLTIDPEGAQDHDDGLSLKKIDSGYELGIHIADVSEFVYLHSELDKEALNRATSVYLHDRVIPMLPNKLSQDLCSLDEGKDRLALSVLIRLDRSFTIQDWEVVESIVRNAAFLTYQQVQDILDGKTNSPYKKDCRLLQDLSKVFFREREKNGSIDFDIAEPVLELSETGIPHTITPSERLQSHRIVEECMLLANRLIAKRYGSDEETGGPLIYRVHEKPNQDKLAGFTKLLSKLSIIPDRPDHLSKPSAIRDLLLKVEDSPYKNLVETLALRSMAKARYTTQNMGHFGLAFKTYCHFTSPIRRYPDLTVHRIVKAALRQKNPLYNRLELQQVADRSSEQEQRALEAERAFIRLKQLRWLNERIGEQFNGVISGVIAAGFFVELETSLAEGLVPVDTMEEEMIFEEERFSLRGRRSHRTFSLGDLVTVRVLSVDLKKRRANFTWVSE